MPEHEIFIGLSEVAIVFAGFAGVSVILSRGGPGELREIDAARVGIMVETSLAYALFALLPLALWGIGLQGPTLWISCSSGLAVYTSILFIRAARGIRRHYQQEPGERDHPAWIAVTFGAGVLILVVQVLNVFALVFERTSGPYVFGLVLGLANSARLFVRSLSVLRGIRGW